MIAAGIHACHRDAVPLSRAAALSRHELDEASRFSEADAEFLASRGLVYLTSLCLDDPSGRMGTIVAASHRQAAEIAAARGHGETIVGLMGQSWLRNMKIRLLARF